MRASEKVQLSQAACFLIYSLNVQVTVYGRQTVPDRGVVRSCDPLKTLGVPIISLERLNLKSSNFVHTCSSRRLQLKASKTELIWFG